MSLQEWREGVLVVVSMAAIFLLAVIIVGVKVKRDQRSEAIRNQQINLTIIDMNLDLTCLCLNASLIVVWKLMPMAVQCHS